MDADFENILSSIEDEAARELTEKWHDVCSPNLNYCQTDG